MAPTMKAFHTLLRHPGISRSQDGVDRWQRHNRGGDVRKHLLGRRMPTPFQHVAIMVTSLLVFYLRRNVGL